MTDVAGAPDASAPAAAESVRSRSPAGRHRRPARAPHERRAAAAAAAVRGIPGYGPLRGARALHTAGGAIFSGDLAALTCDRRETFCRTNRPRTLRAVTSRRRPRDTSRRRLA